jgi:hypothetical protein
MKRLLQVFRWGLVAFAVAVLAVLVIHLTLRPNPEAATAEQYAVLAAYIEPDPVDDGYWVNRSRAWSRSALSFRSLSNSPRIFSEHRPYWHAQFNHASKVFPKGRQSKDAPLVKRSSTNDGWPLWEANESAVSLNLFRLSSSAPLSMSREPILVFPSSAAIISNVHDC